MGHEVVPEQCLGAAYDLQKGPPDGQAGAPGRGLLQREDSGVQPPPPRRPGGRQEEPGNRRSQPVSIDMPGPDCSCAEGGLHPGWRRTAHRPVLLPGLAARQAPQRRGGRLLRRFGGPVEPEHQVPASARAGAGRFRDPVPYHSFIAHDHIVRTIAWCRASSDFLATAGDDRKLKFWDLRKTFEPVSVHKRYLSTEICWPLIWSGICVGQQCCYATYGQHGIHYLDAGYLGYKPFFMAPRNGTIWSASFSDWLNSCVTADSIGELIMVLMPDLSTNPNTIKRTVERRFPVVRTEMVQFPGSEREESNGPEPQTYSEAVKKYYLHFHDMDMRSFRNTPQRAPIKHMQATEAKGLISLDKMPLNSLYKVRLNPNLSSQSWVLSGGQSGLVRAHCVRAMNCAIVAKMVRESEAQFAAMFSPQGAAPDPAAAATAVRHSTESTVRVL
ncbi:hypothetical protein ANANG_G00116450 [Anguilla anguilla]|uniref:Uncharacterized protein n=1 Tax=Anguilla anguilla TaxID=7936 RepID=A0A9D3MCQ4_ANGAN|nr:hypothetical protein ANANG_G00116450 [Anguilla anguilla]